MNIDTNKILKEIMAFNGSGDKKTSQKEVDFMAARNEIVQKLLVFSFHELGIKPPTDEQIIIMASVISENADISNYHMKWAFEEAIKRKQYCDIKTPITYRDLEIAITAATSQSVTYSGKAYKRLPKITDKELWGEKVCYLAATHEKIEFEKMKKQELIGYSRQG